jgi:hypothetical protein
MSDFTHKDIIDRIDSQFTYLREEMKATYVTKDEFVPLTKRVRAIENNLSWAIKIVVGAVISGLLLLLGIKKI